LGNFIGGPYDDDEAAVAPAGGGSSKVERLFLPKDADE
jgi:hypothetical protein